MRCPLTCLRAKLVDIRRIPALFVLIFPHSFGSKANKKMIRGSLVARIIRFYMSSGSISGSFTRNPKLGALVPRGIFSPRPCLSGGICPPALFLLRSASSSLFAFSISRSRCRRTGTCSSRFAESILGKSRVRGTVSCVFGPVSIPPKPF